MSRAQNKRVWLGGGAAVAVVIAAVGWLLAISPELSSANDLRTQTASVQQQNLTLESKIAKLRLQNGNVNKLTVSLRAALNALPLDSGLPAFTRQLSSQAARNRISLISVSAGAVIPVAATAAATPSTTVGASAAGLFMIPVTLVSTGSAGGQLALLQAIQVAGPRRALVNSTQLAPASGADNASIAGRCTMTTQLDVFSAPRTASAQAQLDKLLHTSVSN